MAVSIRRASETDRAEIESLVRSAAVNPRDIRWWRFLVAEEGGLIVGIQQVRTHGGGTREVATRVVRPEFRRRGIGAELLRALLVDQSGPLYLQCGEHSAPYYERFGFYRVEPSTLPADFRGEHRIGRLFVALRSLAVRRRLSIVPMKRKAGPETRTAGAAGDTNASSTQPDATPFARGVLEGEGRCWEGGRADGRGRSIPAEGKHRHR